MPLPQMMGTDDSLMGSPGMQQANPRGDPGSQDVTPQDQVKGTVELLSKLRSSNKAQLEAIATQFPAVSKAVKELAEAFDRGLSGVVKEIVKTTQQQEPVGPRVVR